MAGLTGAALAAGAVTPALADSPHFRIRSTPDPIPGGFMFAGQLLHVNGLGEGHDESTITNFHGALGSTFVAGQGTAGDGTRLGYFVDMRLMEGEYVAHDGKRRFGNFAFI